MRQPLLPDGSSPPPDDYVLRDRQWLHENYHNADDWPVPCMHPQCPYRVHSMRRTSSRFCCRACEVAFSYVPRRPPDHGPLCERSTCFRNMAQQFDCVSAAAEARRATGSSTITPAASGPVVGASAAAPGRMATERPRVQLTAAAEVSGGRTARHAGASLPLDGDEEMRLSPPASRSRSRSAEAEAGESGHLRR